MAEAAPLAVDTAIAALKAAGERTRLRILALLGQAELTVKDLTAILGQSQPRISRHLEAAGRGRSDRSLSGRGLGVLPPDRPGAGAALRRRPARR